MADILPFRAFRYTETAGDFTMLMSPLQENKSSKLNKTYDSRSISFLTTSHATDMADILNNWMKEGIIKKDDLPSIYIYYQYFYQKNSPVLSCRKGFLPLLKIQDWESNIILKHEDIFPEIEAYQSALLSNAKLYINPIHGLFTDTDNQLDKYMDESMLHPLFELQDTAGVLHKLSVIHDRICIEKFIQMLQHKKIVIADGHHRYAAALKLSKASFSGETMYLPALLTNTSQNDILLLPYHRLLTLSCFDEERFLDYLKPFVFIKEEKRLDFIQQEISQNIHTFGIITKKTSYIIELKSEVTGFQHPSSPDLRMMDELLLAKIPGFEKIKNTLTYAHCIDECINEINSGIADIAILVRELTINEVMNLSEKGRVLPEKSTYFYPKVLGGIVMSSINSLNGAHDSPCFRNI